MEIIQLIYKLNNHIQDIKDIKYNGPEIEFTYKGFPLSLRYECNPKNPSIEYCLTLVEYNIHYFTYYPSLIDHKELFQNLYKELMILKPNRSKLEDLIYID